MFLTKTGIRSSIFSRTRSLHLDEEERSPSLRNRRPQAPSRAISPSRARSPPLRRRGPCELHPLPVALTPGEIQVSWTLTAPLCLLPSTSSSFSSPTSAGVERRSDPNLCLLLYGSPPPSSEVVTGPWARCAAPAPSPVKKSRWGPRSRELAVGGAVQHIVRQLPLPVPFRDGQIRRRKLPPQQAPQPPPAPSVSEGAVGLSVKAYTHLHAPREREKKQDRPRRQPEMIRLPRPHGGGASSIGLTVAALANQHNGARKGAARARQATRWSALVRPDPHRPRQGQPGSGYQPPARPRRFAFCKIYAFAVFGPAVYTLSRYRSTTSRPQSSLTTGIVAGTSIWNVVAEFAGLVQTFNSFLAALMASLIA